MKTPEMTESPADPHTPTEPKRYLRDASRRSVRRGNVSNRTYQASGLRTKESTDLVGRHEHHAELLVVLEVDSPDGIAVLVEPGDA